MRIYEQAVNGQLCFLVILQQAFCIFARYCKYSKIILIVCLFICKKEDKTDKCIVRYYCRQGSVSMIFCLHYRAKQSLHPLLF